MTAPSQPPVDPLRSAESPFAPRRTRPPSASESLDATCDYVAGGDAEQLVRVLDRYLDDLKAGKQPSRDALIDQHPQLASQLEACLAGLDFIHGAEQATHERPQRLGDYRIIREVGRGGMGAVYEAEQLSLGRRVALKVLRFGGVSDPEAIERFQREAETVANLHHTNIVPIFAVGSDRGVNFYAMQFIDGLSLAEVLAQRATALSPNQVAEIGLQAAEALAHAHQRGVVHRDVKPSNLLLDQDQRVWLTDFGLARRLEDVTLSLTGALLGTPRYMSPEQATASTKRVDHRSDLFSLGATLYELLLREPAFSGESPHDVIQHILTDEPVPLRSVDPSIPRDLETIVMKCLVKDPQHRYAGASELADDLRAYLDERPIKARRASTMELASRWFKQNRRSATLATTAASITIFVTLLASLGHAQYRAWRQAKLQLAAIRPPLVAEIMDRAGEVEQIDTLPMQRPVALTADTYQVRLSGEGRLSQTYSLDLQRGHHVQATLSLDNDYLFAPQTIERTFDIVDLGSESAVVLWNENGVALRNQWQREINPEAEPFRISPGFEWPWSSPVLQYSGYGSYRYQPWVVQSFMDVNGDGVGDVVMAARHQSWLAAFSGADGNILWFAPRGDQLTTPRSQSPSSYAHEYRSTVIGEPIIAGDLDNDDVPDLLVTILNVPTTTNWQGQTTRCERWIETVSGASGKTLWKYDLRSEFFDLPTGTEVPYDLRWFIGGSGGMSSGGRSSMNLGKHIARSGGHQERNGFHAYQPTPAELISIAGNKRVVCVAGTHLVQLDPQTGLEVEPPRDLGIRIGTSPQWVDVDDDGSSELVGLEEIPTNPYPYIPKARVHVWSVLRGESLWSKLLDADWPRQPSWTVESLAWPLVVDLNSDGKHELMVPHRRSSHARYVGQTLTDSMPWGEILLLEGSTGHELWKRQMISIDSQVDSFIAGPDLNGDGTQELFTATLAGRDYTIYVDALSGVDGSPVWTEKYEARNPSGMSASLVLGNLTWWNAGPDGWPQLLVPLKDDQGPTPQSLICAFSAGTGQVTHYGYGLDTMRLVDLDRDGLDELLLLSARSSTRCDFGGVLSCVRGIGLQPWKRLGDPGQPVADFDRDGVLDFVLSWGDGTLIATSGANGESLWQDRPVPAVDTLKIIAAIRGDGSLEQHSVAPETVDLDGDGVGDLLACEPSSGGRGLISPFHAISGKTGRLLWSMSDVNARLTDSIAIACEDLDKDGSIEVAWLAALDQDYPSRLGFSSNDSQLWLFVAEGRSGRLKWSQPLSPAYGHSMGKSPPFQFQRVDLAFAIGDLNRDGTVDLVAPAIDDMDNLELRALDGRSGATLWSRTRNPDGLSQESLRNWIPPTLCDLDGDGTLELSSVEPAPTQSTGGSSRSPVQFALLSAHDGVELWTKSMGTNFPHFQSLGDQRGKALRPHAIQTGENDWQIGVLLPGNHSKFAMFDHSGNLRERALKGPEHVVDVWVCKNLSPGVDGLAFIEEQSLIVVIASDLDHVVAQRSFPRSEHLSLLNVHAATDGASPVIALTKGATDNSVLGIEANTGQTVWSCPGPILRDVDDGVYMTPQRIALLGHTEGQAPLVSYTLQYESECRQATLPEAQKPTIDMHRLTSAAHQSHAVHPPSAVDTRWLRPLPWTIGFDSIQGRMVPFVLWALFFSGALILMPMAYIAFSLRHQQFDLKALLGLPLVAAVILFAALIPGPDDNDFRTVSGRVFVAVGLVPLWIATILWLRQWWTGRYGQAVFWALSAIGVSCIIAAFLLTDSLSRSPLLPQERIDWTGWYQVLWMGLFVTAWIMTVTYLISGLVKLIRLGTRRWRMTAAA